MKKLNKKQKLIILIAIITIVVIIGIAFVTNAIRVNIANEKYNSSNSDSNNGNLLPEYIKKGITLGGVTGTLESLDTSDATALPEDILWGETAYVKGKKITGTRIETVAQGKEAKCTFEKDITLIDDLENQVRIPEGFKIAKDSATVVEDGIVIEDKDGNQFVWIPARTGTGATINLSSGGTATIAYRRTAFKGENITTDYTETMPSDEEASVNAWGGYYIGRFEAGDIESTDSKTMRAEGASQENTITIKKGQAPYNYITQANAKTKAEEMDEAQQYATATTKLVSSYAWDTAISYIQIKNSNYGTNSPEGNYRNTTFTYTDITGASQTKNNNSSTLVPIGQTTAVSNIYDMGGNLYEYTTESSSYENYPYVLRGGSYYDYYGVGPAGYRSVDYGYADSYLGSAFIDGGFRVTLYCSTES